MNKLEKTLRDWTVIEPSLEGLNLDDVLFEDIKTLEIFKKHLNNHLDLDDVHNFPLDYLLRRVVDEKIPLEIALGLKRPAKINIANQGAIL